jgi:hypothetical protein
MGLQPFCLKSDCFYTMGLEAEGLFDYTLHEHEPTPPFLNEFDTSKIKEKVHAFNILAHFTTHKYW